MDWQDISTAPKGQHILIWHPELGAVATGAADWWTWQKRPTHWARIDPPGSDPTPAAAKARATKATEWTDARLDELSADLFKSATFISDSMSGSIGEHYGNLRHAARSAIANLRMRLNILLNIPPPEAKETEDEEHAEWLHRGIDFALTQLCKWMGVEPASVSWDAATETVDGDVNAVIGNIMRAKMGEDWSPEAKDGAAPSPETGWRLVPVEATGDMTRAAVWALDNARERDGKLQTERPYTPQEKHAIRYRAMIAAAPAAPSPDLAALEELAVWLSGWEKSAPFIDGLLPDKAGKYAVIIRSILKAQPNAVPSADGGKGGKA